MPRKPRRTKVAADGSIHVDGYIRVSTEEQSRDGLSLVNQEERIRAYCSLHELILAEIIVDPGVSAKTLERPGLARVLDRLRRGDIDGVVISKLDRLTRSLRDWDQLIEDFFSERAGRRLFSISDSIDTRTAAGRLVLNVIVTVAQWERETTAERTKDALQGKIRRGERCGKVRYGYDLAEDGKKLVPNPVEQQIIGRLQKLRAHGKTYQELVNFLNELGIDTKERDSIWYPSTVHRILTRPIA